MVEDRPRALVALGAAWAVTTAVAILAVAQVGGSLGDAILAPLWLATAVALLSFVGGTRWAMRVAAALVLVAGLARGYALLAGLGVVPVLAATTPVADAAVLVAVLLSLYDSWVERRSRRQDG